MTGWNVGNQHCLFCEAGLRHAWHDGGDYNKEEDPLGIFEDENETA